MEPEKEEFELTQQSLSDPQARNVLKEYTRPWVEDQATKLIARLYLDPGVQPDLVQAGFEVFDKAFTIYAKNASHFKEPRSPFPLYFAWWARQAMVAYLENKDAVLFDTSDNDSESKEV